MKAALLVVVLATAGCGPALNPEIEGAWSGILTLTMPGVDQMADDPTILVLVDGTAAEVRGFCLRGNGIVSLAGDGDYASWSGQFKCPAVSVGECPVVFDYSEIHLDYLGDLLSLDGRGLGSGCGVDRPFEMSFIGLRP